MRFYDLGDQAGLVQPVNIVNKIGYRTFGETFKTMEVPELLVGADASDITTQGGEVDPGRAKDVVTSGCYEAWTSWDFVKLGSDGRKAQRSFDGDNRRVTFDRRGRASFPNRSVVA